MMFEGLPVFGVCGWSGSGKTTLLAAVLPALVGRGLRVAVVKHDAHGLRFDPAAADSDRLRRAGGDVLVVAPGETLGRRQSRAEEDPVALLRRFCREYDLVLVEGFKRLAAPKVWLYGPDAAPMPEDLEGVRAALPWDGDRTAALIDLLERFLEEQHRRVPLWGCVLIGGESRRMGRPKHLLPAADADGHAVTWLEKALHLLKPYCAGVVVAGRGEMPAALGGIVQLADAPDARGPLAGLLAAMRWNPQAAWLAAACDLPRLDAAAIEWLLASRRPGAWMVLPRQVEVARVEPLLACYQPQAREAVEALAFRADRSLQPLVEHEKAIAPPIPAALADAWRDADAPDDLPRG